MSKTLHIRSHTVNGRREKPLQKFTQHTSLLESVERNDKQFRVYVASNSTSDNYWLFVWSELAGGSLNLGSVQIVRSNVGGGEGSSVLLRNTTKGGSKLGFHYYAVFGRSHKTLTTLQCSSNAHRHSWGGGGFDCISAVQFTDHNVLRRKVLHISLREPLKNDCKPLFIDFQCLVMTNIFIFFYSSICRFVCDRKTREKN